MKNDKNNSDKQQQDNSRSKQENKAGKERIRKKRQIHIHKTKQHTKKKIYVRTKKKTKRMVQKQIHNQKEEKKMKYTIISIIYYIIMISYLVTGILLKNWKSVAYSILLGIIGIFVIHYLRDKEEIGFEGFRIKDRRI